MLLNADRQPQPTRRQRVRGRERSAKPLFVGSIPTRASSIPSE